jgi:hypothetical protein
MMKIITCTCTRLVLSSSVKVIMYMPARMLEDPSFFISSISRDDYLFSLMKFAAYDKSVFMVTKSVSSALTI